MTHVVDEVVENASAGRSTAPAQSAASLRILVVDDNADSASTMALLLSLYGYEVEVANDGVDAIGYLDRFEPDVALLDIGMPKMNGYALAEHIRARKKGKQPMLIAVTGWGQEDDLQRAKAAGFDHHFVKPVEPSELFEVVPKRAP